MTEELKHYCKEWELKIGAFTELCFDNPQYSASLDQLDLPDEAKTLISGLPFAVKDNIAVRGFLLSCGSKHLAAFRSPYTASAVQKLLALGALLIGKTNLDEFAMSSTTDTSGIKQTNNPWDINRVAGGSSGGSAAAVAAGMVPYALGSDTSGSVRQPAGFCGVVGLKPTYGAVSRYGLAAYGSSLEGIGVLSDSAARARAVFAVIRGKDPMDSSSRNVPVNAPPLYAQKNKSLDCTADNAADKSSGTIGFLSPEAMAKALSLPGANAEKAVMEIEVLKAYEYAKEGFVALGYKLSEAEIPGLQYAAPACFTIAAAEGSSNMARFDGIRFGRQPPFAENPGELVDKARGIGFGEEVKLRILLGTYVLQREFQETYYLRALRIQSGIKAGLEALLGGAYDTVQKNNDPPKFDALLLPIFPYRAFGRGADAPSSLALKVSGVFNCLASLTGLPSVSFPASVEDNLPVGFQLLGRSFSEGILLDMAEAYEKHYPIPHPAGFKAFWKPAL